jgi:hypothetical protein
VEEWLEWPGVWDPETDKAIVATYWEIKTEVPKPSRVVSFPNKMRQTRELEILLGQFKK